MIEHVGRGTPLDDGRVPRQEERVMKLKVFIALWVLLSSLFWAGPDGLLSRSAEARPSCSACD
jgi:hypothetical protein